MGIQDNAVQGALQGRRLWITCGYFVSHPWVFAVGLVPRGLHDFLPVLRRREDFLGRAPYHKKRFSRGGCEWLGSAGGGT